MIPILFSSTSPPPASTRRRATDLQRLRELTSQGKTLLLTTHFMEEASACAIVSPSSTMAA